MRKSYKFRAKISKFTENNCLKWLELNRSLYNIGLKQRILLYKQFNKSISLFDQFNQLPELKTAFPEFKQVNAQCLQNTLDKLDKAFQAFFKRVKRGETPGFPRFKSADRFDSFTLLQWGWKLDGKYLHIKHVGRFKLFLSRPIQGVIKTVTIKRTSTNEWFITFSCDNVLENALPRVSGEVGIDVGIKSFCVDSDNYKVENPKFFKQSEELLAERQRSLSRKKKGSVRRRKAKLLVAKTHRKIVNQRSDFAHKLANYYVAQYSTIYVENLNIQNMMKNSHLSKSIQDVSWSTFFNLLTYKAAEAGRVVVKVNPSGTSQLCSSCGEKVPKSLAVRVHNCPFCGFIADRDYNASLNIKKVGQTFQTDV